MKPEPPVVQPTNNMGTPTEPKRPPPVAMTRSRFKLNELLEHRGIMLLMLFGVTAALGIPFLWKSRAFSRNEKILWSVLVSLYTILIFWIFFKIMWWSYSNIADALK